MRMASRKTAKSPTNGEMMTPNGGTKDRHYNLHSESKYPPFTQITQTFHSPPTSRHSTLHLGSRHWLS